MVTSKSGPPQKLRILTIKVSDLLPNPSSIRFNRRRKSLIANSPFVEKIYTMILNE